MTEASPTKAADLSANALSSLADGVLRIWSLARLSATDASGRLVLDVVFGGDVALFHRRGRKSASLGRLSDALAERGMDLSVGRLRRLVNQHLVLRELSDAVDTSSLVHLSPSHLEEVMALDGPARVRVLVDAEERGLSVRQVRALVRSESGPCSAQIRRRQRRSSSSGVVLDDAATARALQELEVLEARAREILGGLRSGRCAERAAQLRVLGVAVRFREVGEGLQTLAHSSSGARVRTP